jgi:hypothetical protein
VLRRKWFLTVGQVLRGLSAWSAEAGRLGRNRAGGPGSSGRGPIGLGAMMEPGLPRMFALESPSPDVEGVSPDLRSRAGRKPILRARVSGHEAARNDHACWNHQPGAFACSTSLAWPFTNRTTLSHALLVLPRSAIERDLRALPPGRTELAGGGCTPWKESVHNRYAGRPEPMVWRPSGET